MEIVLWHGGRNLEYNYRENFSSKKGRWEHGAGLYLTTHYETARKYSKGNGKTYEVTVELEPEKCITNIDLPIESVLNFYSRNIKKSMLPVCSESLNKCMKRMKNTETVCAESFQNIIINNEGISHHKSNLITEFLVENGIQYGLVKNYAGRDETVLVVYDKSIVKKVNFILAKDVSLELYERVFPQTNWKMILPECESPRPKGRGFSMT